MCLFFLFFCIDVFLVYFVLRFLFVWFFFFKQKTAYEMRISDWSSDVCSSDLCVPGGRARAAGGATRGGTGLPKRRRDGRGRRRSGRCDRRRGEPQAPGRSDRGHPARSAIGAGRYPRLRSEEHTSELQSLMRISYAVFCLKKKTKHNQTYPTTSNPGSVRHT